jgi:hypothetical protein
MSLKTQPTDADVDGFLAAIPDPARRADAQALCALMADVTGRPPVLWGTSIVGFGTFVYRLSKGRADTWFPVGFASRKSDLTIYLGTGMEPWRAIVDRLGPHKEGRGCLYIKRLGDVDQDALRELIGAAYASPVGAIER